MRTQTSGYRWSLVSAAVTALNFLVIYIADSYKPPSPSGSPMPPTPTIFYVLFAAAIFLCLFGVGAAIGGMRKKELAAYTWIALVLATLIGQYGCIRLGIST
jgi:hypothetical protein